MEYNYLDILSMEDHKKNYKGGLDVYQTRRTREETTVKIRKEKRSERLNRRRRLVRKTDETVHDGDFHLHRSVLSCPSSTHAQKYTSLKFFRTLLSVETNPPTGDIIQWNLVPLIITYLANHSTPDLQFEAAWILTNITSGTHDDAAVVVCSGAIPVLISGLSSKNTNVQDQCIWCLGNLVGDSDEYRATLLNSNMVPMFTECFKNYSNTNLSLIRNLSWAVSNCCRGKKRPPDICVAQLLVLISSLLFVQDKQTITDACWGASYICDGEVDDIQMIVEAGLTLRLVELINHPDNCVVQPSLRAIGNILTGSDEQTQLLLNQGVLTPLSELIRNQKKAIRKESLWALSNITAGTLEQINMLFSTNIIPFVIETLKNETYDLKKEAIWCLANAASGGHFAHLAYLVDAGCLPALCDLLIINDATMVIIILETINKFLKYGDMNDNDKIKNIIEECDGLEKISDLQNHQNHGVYEKSVYILETYFSAVSENDDCTPSILNGQFTFGDSNFLHD